jgi:hypothetical protein
MSFRHKKRSPYDKVVKHAIELLRQELAPLQDISANQLKIIAQNEKHTAFLRQIWDRLEQRDSPAQNNNDNPG